MSSCRSLLLSLTVAAEKPPLTLHCQHDIRSQQRTVLTARRCASAIRPSVCLSVCLSQAGITDPARFWHRGFWLLIYYTALCRSTSKYDISSVTLFQTSDLQKCRYGPSTVAKCYQQLPTHSASTFVYHVIGVMQCVARIPLHTWSIVGLYRSALSGHVTFSSWSLKVLLPPSADVILLLSNATAITWPSALSIGAHKTLPAAAAASSVDEASVLRGVLVIVSS